MPRLAQVLLPLPLPEAFDYLVPDEMTELAPGDHVAAPLGPRTVRGVVVGVRDAQGVNRPLKTLVEKLQEPALPPGALAFVQWVARYACQPPGEALAMTLRGLRHPLPKGERQVISTDLKPARATPARLRVLAQATEPLSMAELARRAGVSAGVVKGLVEEGVLRLVEAPPAPAYDTPDPHAVKDRLNPGQAAATEALETLRAKGGFQAALIDGITGSGKTEVYLEVAARILTEDPTAQILILLPEIALTQQVIERVATRFNARPAEWHSGVPGPRRRQTWEGVAAGDCRIVVGARSALFLPYRNLRLIVVDEEHDSSYKQEEGFIYHARDMAVARAKLENCLVLLASATPSLETLWNAQSGRYGWLRLSTRHGVARLPDVDLIDLRQTPPETGRWLSPPLVAAMAEVFGRGEQSLLFLNRRGYAPLVLCKACGQKLTSPDTDSWLVEHRYSGRLVCHLTGFSMPKPERCPHCGAKDSLIPIGPGVERLEEEARSLFPEARIAVFSSDTTPDAESARAMISAMEQGEIDIMVATQAAAKGHNFPNLTLVGVVDADLGLRGGDLRAAERTFQLLAQAAGRAGRADLPGRALIQTWMPEHAVMQALKDQDRDAFIAAETDQRRLAGLPPFGRLAALILSSPDPAILETVGRSLAAAAPNAEGVEVFGPADAPLSLVRGKRRKRFLVRTERNVDLQGYLNAWRARVKIPNAVRLVVDIDPYSFL